MSEEINHGRRRFFGTAAMTAAAAHLGMTVPADANPRTNRKVVRDVTSKSESADANATVVRVHGAWADGSSWARVITPLQSRGLKAIAAPIPLTSLSPWYLVAEEDRMINPTTQLFLARRMGARLRAEKVDHASPITAPKLVVRMIREAVTSPMSHPNGTQQHG